VIFTLIRQWWERLRTLDHGKRFLVEGGIAGAACNAAGSQLAVSINLKGHPCGALLPTYLRVARISLIYCQTSYEDSRIALACRDVAVSINGEGTLGQSPSIIWVDPQRLVVVGDGAVKVSFRTVGVTSITIG
jgi:hypothetical protein